MEAGLNCSKNEGWNTCLPCVRSSSGSWLRERVLRVITERIPVYIAKVHSVVSRAISGTGENCEDFER